jgi:YgiT-type zinc finger domain-containing protein
MNCLICRQSNLIYGPTSITFERGEFRLLIRGVPAWVCPSCGEAVVDEDVSIQIIGQAESLFAQGIREDVCEYQSAAATEASISDSSTRARETFKSSWVER